MVRALFLALLGLAPDASRACETALLLAIDVSGSIDRGEYALQVEGLSLALADPTIIDTLVQGRMALAVVQWSGVGRQELSLPWQRIGTSFDVAAFRQRVEAMPRAFSASDTAVGDALDFAIAQMGDVEDCTRKIIDISGDGPENVGYTVSRARGNAEKAGIAVNAIAIEDMGQSAPITAFYRKWVVTRNGFVITARGLQDYPRAIREKITREITRPSG